MNPNETQSLERILESIVVVSWTDLMPALAGLIHVEYAFAADGTLDYLKFWSSVSRGHWLLAAEYWTSSSTAHSTGIHFQSGYESETLAHTLESVMHHQTEFLLPEDFGRQGLLQIATPTQQETAMAAALIDETLRHLSSFSEPLPV
jgi:hypothetical protein